MNTHSTLADTVLVGVIQTTLDNSKAWVGHPQISITEDNKAWDEIRKAVRSLSKQNEKPKIILLPELALPRTRLNEFERMTCALNAIAITGVDYRLDTIKNTVRNEGLIIVPRNFWRDRPSKYGSRIWFGKHIAAPAEAESLAPNWSFIGDSNVYVFDAGPLGRIGVSICYDFMDIERALLYRGRVHHLIVIAYNRDVKLFESLAVSLSRTAFCNVIVCNTGQYGGSLLVSPFYNAHERIGYSIEGGKLSSVQCIKLCVKGIDDAIHAKSIGNIYKHVPPGFTPHF